MIPLWLLAIFVFGVNFTLWGTAGLARALENRVRPPQPPRPSPVARARPARVHRSRVAVLMAAHNEEVVLGESLAAITRLVPASNVHVVSDGSTDRTVELALACGVNVTATPSNVGKAGALEEGVRHFALDTRYDAVLLLDADTRLDPGYFDAALPQFDDPDVVAVAGCAATDWSASRRGFLPFLFTAHRARIYALLQRLLKFGQTWRRTNATLIVPGFASLYRAEALPLIDINPPGLVIEDFNMTFEVYRKRLGKVGFSLKAIAVTQDPDAFRDYVHQTRRWALGFWQSVRRYRPRADLFSFMLGLYVLELVFASLFMALLPLMVVLLLLALIPGFLSVPVAGDVTLAIGHYVNLPTIAFGILVPDLLLTLAVVLTERRARYLLMAPLYLPLRCLDACIALWTLPQAWGDGSGRWQSPTRRSTDITATPDLATIGAGVGAGASVGSGASVGAGSGMGSAAGMGSGASVGAGASVGSAADMAAGASVGSGASVGAGSGMGSAAGMGSGASVGAGASVGSAADMAAGASVGSGASVGAGSGMGSAAGMGSGASVGAGASVGSGAGMGSAGGVGAGASVGSAACVGSGTDVGSGTGAAASAGLPTGTGLTADTGLAARTDLGPGDGTRLLPSPFPRDLSTQHNGSSRSPGSGSSPSHSNASHPSHSNGSSGTLPSLPPTTTSDPAPTSDTEPGWPPEWPPDPFPREKVG